MDQKLLDFTLSIVGTNVVSVHQFDKDSNCIETSIPTNGSVQALMNGLQYLNDEDVYKHLSMRFGESYCGEISEVITEVIVGTECELIESKRSNVVSLVFESSEKPVDVSRINTHNSSLHVTMEGSFRTVQLPPKTIHYVLKGLHITEDVVNRINSSCVGSVRIGEGCTFAKMSSAIRVMNVYCDTVVPLKNISPMYSLSIGGDVDSEYVKQACEAYTVTNLRLKVRGPKLSSVIVHSVAFQCTSLEIETDSTLDISTISLPNVVNLRINSRTKGTLKTSSIPKLQTLYLGPLVNLNGFIIDSYINTLYVIDPDLGKKVVTTHAPSFTFIDSVGKLYMFKQTIL